MVYFAILFIFVIHSCGGGTDFSGSSYKTTRQSVDKSIPKFIDKVENKSPLEQSEDRLFINSEESSLKEGVKFEELFKYSILKNRSKEGHTWITNQVELPENELLVLDDVFSGSFVVNKSSLTVESLKREIEEDNAIVTVSIESSIEPTGFKPSTSSAIADEMKFLDSDYSFFQNFIKKNSDLKKRVRVGVIDTGLDVNSVEFKDTFVSGDLGNILDQSNDVQDKNGHGTRIASIISGKTKGIADGAVELVPLLVSSGSSTTIQDLTKAIIVGTNLGVEVMNISLSSLMDGCTPSVGHVIHRAIEKGVFFSIAAGNGIRHIPEHSVGFPVTAARDDGPLNFLKTAMPACWGKYFLGAVAVGSIEKKSSSYRMADFSNYGEDIEIAASGVNIDTVGLGNKVQQVSGTSVSAAYVSAAAALAIYHHKINNLPYTPWYIENLLVESSYKSKDLTTGIERRPRFGSVLSFSGLADILAMTEKMTQKERDNIPTVNPRFNEGWIPGQESNLARLNIV